MSTNESVVAARASVPSAGGAAGPVAAFFDLDHTIIATSASFAFNNEFIKSGLMSRMSLAKMAVSRLAIAFTPSGVAEHERVREIAGDAVRGMTRTEVQRVIAESLDEIIAPKVFAEAKELIADHRNQGHEVIVLSAGAAEMVEPVAHMLGVQEFRATQMEVDEDNRYTGRIEFYCFADNKAVALREIAAQRGIDMSASYAYSDSDSDIAMLSSVGHPVAVNPNRQLRREAVQRGWPILTFTNPTALFPDPEPGSWAHRVSSALRTAGSLRPSRHAALHAANTFRRMRTADGTAEPDAPNTTGTPE